MNRNRYRLLFNESTESWVAVPETAAARGKRSRPANVRALVAAVSAVFSTCSLAADALPVAAQNFVDARVSGSATVSQTANRMVINQTGNNVLLNWQSFSIGKGNSVHFDQASASMRAINVVAAGGPRSDIDGSLTAKGQIFLFNQAGIMFGANARVDVGGLVGSTLKLNDALLESALNSLGAQTPAFSLYDDADRAALATGDIAVALGARIVAAKNGRVLLAAPNVTNGGRIEAEEGQVVLAAGEKIYIADPIDSRLRGFLVEVSDGGKVTTEAASELLSDRGNITLTGLNIRHAGAARATTSVTLNGTIYLKARDTVAQLDRDPMFPDAETLEKGETIPVGQRTGRIELAAGSELDIGLDEETAASTVRDDVLFRPSEINLFGRQIVLEDAVGDRHASIRAPSGTLRMSAVRDQGADSNPTVTPRVYVGTGATIDLSGVDATVDADHEIVRVELRGDEVSDSPLLRDEEYGKALFGEDIWVDTRIGTQLVDISGYLGSIARTIDEKSTSGGNLTIVSDGEVRMQGSSSIDLSGGTVTYRAGKVDYTLVKSSDGRTQAVESALADRVYLSKQDRTRTVGEVVEGRDAGSMSVTAQSMVLDGGIVATRTSGVTQRALSSRWTGPGVSETIGLPRAGRLLLTLSNGDAPQDVRFVNPGSSRSFDETSAMPDELWLNADMFASGGVGSFELNGAGAVTLPADVNLNVTPTALYDSDNAKWSDGSRFAISASAMQIDGTITAAGGAVELRTDADAPADVTLADRSIVFGSSASISAAGRWTRDERGNAGYVAKDGGSITIDALGNLTFPSGASFDVSAGGWSEMGGRVHVGDAGALSLLAGSRIANGSGVSGSVGDYYGTLTLGGKLSGYGVQWQTAVGGSGSLFLRSARIAIDGGDTRNEGDTLFISPELFSAHGFEKFDVTGGNGVVIGRDDGAAVEVVPQVDVRVLPVLPRASLASLGGTGGIASVDRNLRGQGSSLAFSAPSNLSGVVEVKSGAVLGVDAGGAISLLGNRGITVAGSLSAPGGRITLDQDAPATLDSDLGDYYTGATVFLTPTAVLDVSGTFLRTPFLNYADGSVLDGGDIGLHARRGYLVVQEGATLKADGTSEVLRQATEQGRSDTVVSSNGGSISLSAREGLYADPTLSAKAGGPGAIGGSLSVRLAFDGLDWADLQSLPAALSGARTLDILASGNSGSSTLVAGGTPDAASYAGRGAFALSRLTDSGIVDLELGAVGGTQYGALAFGGDLSFAVTGRLKLDSANIVGRNGADVLLTAASVDWRNDDNATKNHAQPTSVSSDGSLTLGGDLVSVTGNLAADGFATVELKAAGDLRASAASSYFEEGGTLATSGNLTLTAAQVYPTTASDYSFEVQNNTGGVLTVRHSGATPGLPYSALGRLTLAAPTVRQGGRVVAPLGSIELLSQDIVRTSGLMSSSSRTGASGGTVELEAGSLTSVSASGLLLPYGQTTLSGGEWIYLITGQTSLALDATPEPSIRVNADNVLVRGGNGDTPAARLDLAGGGDLQAWEWIPGTGGSKDVLSAAQTRDVFAIVPSLGSSWAPYDAAIYAEDANGLQAGEAITLSGGVSGLPAGTYALLPARYALLPGAFLVRVSRGDQSVVGSKVVSLADGSRLMSAQDARITATGPVAAGGKSYVARIYTSDQVGSLSEYKLSTTADVFDDGRSSGDAGRLSLQIGRSLLLSGVLDTAHSASARGARVDITAQALAVLGEGAEARDGEVGLSVDQINALNAESLVLGGTRREAGGSTELDMRSVDDDGLALHGASSVRIDTRGSTLSAPDIVLAARDSVSVEGGSRIAASGEASPEALAILGSGAAADGALLRVSNGNVALPLRDTPTGQRGLLTLGDGAVISGRSVVLDSTLNTVNNGARISLPSAGGALALTGATISVGEVSGNEGGLIFDTEALAALGDPSSLILKSYGSLNLYGAVNLGSSSLKTLTIDATGIGGYANDGLTQSITASTVNLLNSNAVASGADAFASGLGNGTLSINAETVQFGSTPEEGSTTAGFAVRGFGALDVNASTGVVLGSDGHFEFAADRVDITTPRVSARAGADVRIDSAGHFVLDGSGGVAGSGEVGGLLSVSARDITMSTLIDMPSGQISLAADEDIVLNGRIVAAGVVKDYLGRKVATPGGSVSLSAKSGNLTVAEGALIDVSAAAAGGDAGSIALSAPGGTLSVAAGSLAAEASGDGLRGAIDFDVASAATLDGLIAVSADFTRRWSARVRSGDSRIDADLRADEIQIGVDAGTLTVGGTLDASGAEKGGRIELSARRAGSYTGSGPGAGDLVLESGALLDARATTWVASAEGSVGEGGTVVLEASPFAAGGETGSAKGGTIRIAAGADIQVGTASATVDGIAVESAARKGEVTLRAERVGNSTVSVTGNLGDAVHGARNLFIEGTRIYGGSTLDMATAHTHSTSFMTDANVSALRTALGLPSANVAGSTQVHIRPHVEFRTDGNFTIAATDLATRTYLGGTEAGTLTVRAGGTLSVNGTLSDGFGRAKTGSVTNLLGALTSAGLANTTFFDLGTRDTAWSLRLASGADTAASSALALQSLETLEAAGRGDLVVATGAQIRTGAGSIEIAAGRDLTLAGAKSAIYTAGYQDARGSAFDASTQLNINSSGNRRAEYAMNGGDIAIVAQRDVKASESTQTVGAWLFRQGDLEDDGSFSGTGSSARNPTWYARIDQFDQGIATFGGGDISLRSGGDVRNVGVSTVSNGRLSGNAGTQADIANLRVLGGGDISVAAGGDISSASFYVDRGTLLAQAGGDFGSARSDGAGSVLVLGDASATLRAAGDIDVETIASATMAQQLAASTTSSRETYFVSYGSDNRVDILSYGGSATLKNTTTPWGNLALFGKGAVAGASGNRTMLLPASLSLVAMGGDATVGNGMVLLPSTYNDVLIAARDNILLSTASGAAAQIRIADVAPDSVPGVANPTVSINDVGLTRLLNFSLVSGTIAHDAALNAARTVEPVRLIAETGNISVPYNGVNLPLVVYSPQPVLAEAGGNINNLTLRAQHFTADDLTRVRAGGDITFSAVLGADGIPSGEVKEGVIVGGQGKVEMIAGGNIDLANSFGIVTRGNYDNPALPEAGASILVQAGSRDFDSDALLALLRGDAYDEVIVSQTGAESVSDFLTVNEGDDFDLQKLKSDIAAVREKEGTRLNGLLGRMDSAIVSWMRSTQGVTGGDAEALAAFSTLPSAIRETFYEGQRPLLSELLNASLRYAGFLGDLLGTGQDSFKPGYDAIAAAFPNAGAGNIDLFASQIKSEQGGSVNVYAPGGEINVGVAGSGAAAVAASRQGIFAIGEGEINAVSDQDFQVGPSRVFTMGGGDIQIWSSYGNIDAGKGSSTASATPPPQVVFRGDTVVLDISASVSGSGVRTLQKSADVDLSVTEIRVFAPGGAVIAQDAGFGGSNIVLVAQEIIGNNFKGDVSGNVTVAAPAAPSAPASVPTEANKAVDQALGPTAVGKSEERERNSLLTVELVGVGDTATASGGEVSAPSDEGEVAPRRRRAEEAGN